MEFKKNQIVTVEITDIGSEGEGIGKADGFALFVKDAVPGDVAEARIVKAKKNYAYARLEKIVKPSPLRAKPRCAYYRQCGGCQLQALSYEEQLRFKQEKIRNNLIRIGGFAPETVDVVTEPIVGMDEPFRYRNKAQYPVGTDRDGRPIAGFYAGRTHSIIANTDCALGPAENRTILEQVLEYMEENRVPAYDEATGRGLVRHILIRKGFASGELMVCLVINLREDSGEGRQGAEFLPKQDSLIDRLRQIPGMTCISVSINNENTNVIMGREVHTLWGSDAISDTLRARDMNAPGYPHTGRSLIFHISPLSFYQVNPVQTEKLYSLVLEYAELTGKETVWDLYCGIGTISLFLAGGARKVYGVEEVSRAVEDARENALRNGVDNAEFFAGRAEEVLPEFYAAASHRTDREPQAEMLHPDVIVVDPPRKGCDEACLATMLQMRPSRIVYVSCDSATLARDLKILCEGGYELRKVRGVDQFGMTVHVECVVLMSRTEANHSQMHR